VTALSRIGHPSPFWLAGRPPPGAGGARWPESGGTRDSGAVTTSNFTELESGTQRCLPSFRGFIQRPGGGDTARFTWLSFSWSGPPPFLRYLAGCSVTGQPRHTSSRTPDHGTRTRLAIAIPAMHAATIGRFRDVAKGTRIWTMKSGLGDFRPMQPFAGAGAPLGIGGSGAAVHRYPSYRPNF
jgi:hypothetical protein